MRNEIRTHFLPGFGGGTPVGVQAGKHTKKNWLKKRKPRHSDQAISTTSLFVPGFSPSVRPVGTKHPVAMSVKVFSSLPRYPSDSQCLWQKLKQHTTTRLPAIFFIVIGSSLVVQPAAQMPVIAKQNGAKLVIINLDETPCDPIADCVVHSQACQTIAAVIERVREALANR